MISTLRGEVLARQSSSVLIEVSGVGFEVLMSARDLASLPEPGSTTRILTKLVVRDDTFVLYGFCSPEAKSVFERLISVSGVGPKVALAVLSTYAPAEVTTYIALQDAPAIQRVPGVGKKMASRIILELKDAFDASTAQNQDAFESSKQEVNASFTGALEALLSMGFTDTEASLALKGCPIDASEAILLQYALKRLGG